MIRGRSFVLGTFADLATAHPWAVDADGVVVGHVLTINDGDLATAAGGDLFDVLTLPDALDRPWRDAHARHAWAAAYAAALRVIADEADAVDRAVQDREVLRVVGGQDTDK